MFSSLILPCLMWGREVAGYLNISKGDHDSKTFFYPLHTLGTFRKAHISKATAIRKLLKPKRTNTQRNNPPNSRFLSTFLCFARVAGTFRTGGWSGTLGNIQSPVFPPRPRAAWSPLMFYNFSGLFFFFFFNSRSLFVGEVLSRARATAFELSSARETGTKKAKRCVVGEGGGRVRVEVERLWVEVGDRAA